MSAVELLTITFTLSNSFRVIAYIPQMTAIGRSKDGARSISLLTWWLFAASHLATMFYAIVVIEDLNMAAVFLANTLGCSTIIALTLSKRRRNGEVSVRAHAVCGHGR